jgi:hypothetical protein
MCPDLTGEHLYAYYTNVVPNPEERNGICMARCRLEDQAAPGKWQKYFDGGFTEPGLGGRESLVIELPFPVAGMSQPQVTYLKNFKKYFMLCVAVCSTEAFAHVPPQRSGVFCSVSDDGVHWCMPQLLWLAHTIPVVDREYTGHPCLYVERETATRITGSLVYCYTPKFGGGGDRSMHHLVKRPITLVPSTSVEKTASAPTPQESANGRQASPEERRSGSAPQEAHSASTRSTLSDRLKGTKWINTNKVTFEWTADGKLLHNGKERQWKSGGDDRAEVVFGKDHVDVLVFDESLKTFTQLIKGGPSSMQGRRVQE